MKDLFQNILIVLSVVVLAASCYNEDNRIHATCADGILNQEEERIDCGGPNCDPCPPSCDNGVLDYVDGWQEVGIDCGGPCQELGQLCCENGIWDINPEEPTLSESWVDCKFDNLNPGDPGFNSECPICPTCNNGVHDDGETITIGGVPIDVIDCDEDPFTECPPCDELCDDGLLNGNEGPCVDCGGVCFNCSDAHCFNGMQDTYPNDPYSNETAIDCGGCACPPCAFLCGDGLLNGSEVAIDCGGNDCVACVDPSLCGDGLQNGYETGVDCYDGTDGASACPPCQTLCVDNVCNGFETDTDCGGEDCSICGNDDTGYITYYVNGDFYECNFTSLLVNRVPGNIGNPTDVITFSGGISHNISFFLKDDGLTPNTFSAGTYVINNSDLNPTPNTSTLINKDGVTFTGQSDPAGMSVTFTSLAYTAPPPVPPGSPGGLIEGTFNGVMYDTFSGTSVNVSDGVFRLFFTD